MTTHEYWNKHITGQALPKLTKFQKLTDKTLGHKYNTIFSGKNKYGEISFIEQCRWCKKYIIHTPLTTRSINECLSKIDIEKAKDAIYGESILIKKENN